MPADYHIAAAYLRLMLQADHSATALVQEALGAQFHLIQETEQIPGYLINNIFELLEDQGLESLVIKYAQQLDVGNHGPLGFAALSAPNLGVAIDLLVEFIDIRSSGSHAETRLNGNRLEYVLQDRTEHRLVGRWLIESGFLVAKRLIESVTAHPLGDNAEIRFAYPRLDNHRQLAAIYQTPIRYGTKENVLSIPASWLAIPSPLSDPDAFRTNIAKCREIKLRLHTDKSDVRRLVNTRLLNHFERRLAKQSHSDQIPSLEVLAGELHMSPRTLIRKLAKQNSSYKIILQEIRCALAQQMLRETHKTASEIAIGLGYQEPANFARAFKSWTGKNPAAWRRSS
ncbi:MAG: helix-turn-helix domain-containing protein [Pseudomonadota bacterium]